MLHQARSQQLVRFHYIIIFSLPSKESLIIETGKDRHRGGEVYSVIHLIELLSRNEIKEN
jgi:hypothetical protein